ACHKPEQTDTRAEPVPAPIVVQYGPWLLEPLPTQMTGAWSTPDESVGQVAYGETSLDRMARETASRKDHPVTLEGREPTRPYRYRLPGTQHEGLFWTAPPIVDEQLS